MKNTIFATALASFFFLTTNAAQAGIVFDFGANVTAERQAALQAAAAEIEQIIDFKQTVKVSVSFADLQCDDFGGVLGFAGPQSAYRDFSGAPQSGVWYVSAQSADLGFSTAMADTSHIVAQFNKKVGQTGCISGHTWYYGADHNPPAGQIDFLSTAVHEFMHGLGFLSFTGSDGKLLDNDGNANSGHMDNYSTFLFSNATSKSWKIMTDSERAASIINNGLPSNDGNPSHFSNLIWNGAKTTAMVSLLQAGTTGGKARLYAPSSYEGGSSTSHFDVSLKYDTNAHEVMEPFDAFPQESIMATAAFCDMGWRLLRDTDGDTVNDCSDSTPLVLNDADADGVADALDAFPSNAAASADTDNDGMPDAWNQPNPYSCVPGAPTCNGLTLDNDSDNDGVLDAVDNCPQVANANQLDWDNDGVGDVCGVPLPMPGVLGVITKDKTGTAVAYAGDVNKDGYGDYVIGIPGYDIPATLETKTIRDAGRAVVISGKDNAELMSVNGVAAKDGMGTSVAGNADVDNDGNLDVIVGAPKADAVGMVDAGSVTVLYGPDGIRPPLTFYGDKAKALAGTAVALGDVNDDGYADMISGAPKDDDATHPFGHFIDTGSVAVRSGAPGNSKLITYYGDVPGAAAGTSVAAGHVDAVAGAEVIIGAPKDDFVAMAQKNNGSVTVYNFYSSTPVIAKQFGKVANAYLGKSVAAGDIDDDGRDDVLAGAPADDNGKLKNVGSVSVFSGANSFSPVIKYGAVANAALGTSVAAGDVDADGFADIIAGAPKDDVAATVSTKKIVDAGSVTVWSGADCALIKTLYGAGAKDYFGTALSAGDINSDGKVDLVIGAPGDDMPATKPVRDAGSVQLSSGLSLL